MQSLPSDYGFVVLTGVASGFVMAYLGFQVGNARKRLGVPLPSLYADQAEARMDKNKELFNCYQRAHQNALETYAQNLMLLFIGGLKHPLIASAGGCFWIVGRLLYASGYYTGEPKNRARGSVQFVGLLMMLGSTISTALSLLRWI